MDAIDRLVDARTRLSTMLESEKDAAPAHVKEQWTAIISQLGLAIAQLQNSGKAITNLESELARTTRQELKKSEPGPHHIKWGF